MIHDVAALLRRVRGINPCCHSTDRHNSKIGIDPFRSILANERNALPLCKAKADEPHGHLPHPLPVSRPRDIPPEAVLLFPQGNLPGMVFEMPLKMGEKGDFAHGNL